MASLPDPVMEFMGRVALEVTKMRPLIPTYLHLLLSAIFPIYVAAHASLVRPSSAAKPDRKKKRVEQGDLSEDDEDIQVVQKIESLTAWDALTFPLLAGATLTSLYFLITWLEDPAILNKILAVYFSQIGIFFGARFLKDIFSTLRSVILPAQYSLEKSVWHADSANAYFKGPAGAKPHSSPLPGRLRSIPLPKKLSSGIWTLRKVIYTKARLRLDIHKVVKLRYPIDALDILSFVVIASVVAWQAFVSTPWYLTNFMGFAFCYGSLQMVTPTTGWVGTLILSALFFYDIYFVFFTPMMVTVATKLEVPIKLLFPRPDGCVMPVGALEGSEVMQEYLDCISKKRTMAMLGLGDIVIPGMMLAFALRFDLYICYLRLQRAETTSSGVDTVKKPTYKSATGGWGERFWTSTNLQSCELKARSFPKPYFHASVFGYLVGMIVTMIVMQVAQHAQPALLYLVPGVLISLWGTALFKGDLKLLWTYTEEEEEETEDKKAQTKTAKEGSKEDKVKADSTEKQRGNETGVATTKKKATDEAESKTKPVASDGPIRLINLSITLPARAESSSITSTVLPEATSASPTLDIYAEEPTNSNSSSSGGTEDSYDVLLDVKAAHEVMNKLSQQVTQEKGKATLAVRKDGEKDGEPAGKKRRKA